VLLAPIMYPRTTNKILRAYLKGVADKDIDENTRLRPPDYQTTWLT
jgi:hypothetical protein